MGYVTKIRSRAFAALILMIPGFAWGQALNPDYLDANEGSPQLERLQPQLPSFGETGYRVRYLGYVHRADPDETLVGHALHSGADEQSTVLATIDKSDSITVIEDGEWSHVVLRRPLTTGGEEVFGEVEPIVFGEEENLVPDLAVTETPTASEEIELAPLETEVEADPESTLPVKPPKPLPAVNLNRPFEGLFTLEPRRFGGFKRKFPYQLLNPTGKRLAYVDVSGVKAVDALGFDQREVSILGVMEPVKKGSRDMIIRARLIRHRN